MGRFSDLLRLNSPFTGRLIKENGETYNRADHLERMYNSNISALSANGELYRAFWQGTLTAGEVAYFAIYIPPNYSHFGFFRQTQVFGDNVESTFFLQRTPYTTTEEEINGYNFDERSGGSESFSKLRKVSGLVEGEQRTPSVLLISADTGVNARTSIQTVSGTISAYDSENFPLFKYENLGVTPVELNFFIEFAEVSNES